MPIDFQQIDYEYSYDVLEDRMENTRRSSEDFDIQGHYNTLDT